MTTDPQAATADAVPAWFLNFVQENARQHAELGERIGDVGSRVARVEGGLNVIRNIMVVTLGAMLTLTVSGFAAAIKYLFGL